LQEKYFQINKLRNMQAANTMKNTKLNGQAAALHDQREKLRAPSTGSSQSDNRMRAIGLPATA